MFGVGAVLGLGSKILSTILDLMKKNPTATIMLVAVGIMGFLYWQQSSHLRSIESELAQVKLNNLDVIQLNDSLSVRVASDGIAKDSLQRSLAAAKELNAELVAAARIRVVPDTVYRDTGVVVVEQPADTTIPGDQRIRYAFVHDTTKAGALHAEIKVPPLPQPIDFKYRFFPSPIEFEVTLLRTKDERAVFGITYEGGGTVEIEAPYANLPRKPDRFYGYLEGLYEPFQSTVLARAGLHWNPFWRLYGFGEVQQSFGNVDNFSDLDTFTLEGPAGFIGIGIQLGKR